MCKYFNYVTTKNELYVLWDQYTDIVVQLRTANTFIVLS